MVGIRIFKTNRILVNIIIAFILIYFVNAATVSHSASELTPGSFAVGNYTFQDSLFISDSVGIGTTSPDQILEISETIDPSLGTAQLRISNPSSEPWQTGEAATGIQFEKEGKITGYIKSAHFRDGSTTDHTYEDAGLAFGTRHDDNLSPSTKMIISNTGNVGIGTDNSSAKLEIKSDDYEDFIVLDRTGIQYVDEKIYISPSYGAANITQLHFNIGSTNTVMALAEDGNVGIGETTPAYKLEIGGGDVNTLAGGYRDAGSCVAGTCASDIRLKRNIENITGSLNRILEINPSTFEFIDKKYGSQGVNYGLIAQEVEKVFPEWVVENEDGYKQVKYGLNIEMNILRAVKELKQEKDLEIQEQREQIQTQEIKIYNLENQNKLLKQALCEEFPNKTICQD